jgi:hypothetical protein
MPDTSKARDAIHEAYARHRDVMGGMSAAMLKLEAAGGLLKPDPRLDDPPLPYPEDSPVWIEHAAFALASAMTASGALTAAILEAQRKVTDLAVEWAQNREGEHR